MELLVQPIRRGTKWEGVAMAWAVMGLNGAVAGQSSKIEAQLSHNQSEMGMDGEGT